MKTKEVLFKCLWLSIFCLHVSFCFAQRGEVIELQVTQPSPNLNIRLVYDKYNLISGQQYAIIIQNLSNKNMHIKGQLAAVLVCDNEVSTRFDVVLKPYEKMGGELGDGMTGLVYTKDCEQFEVLKDDKGYEAHNRIRTIQLRSYSSVIEKTDEEKAQEEKQKQQAIEKQQQDAANKQATITKQNEINNQQQQAAQQRQQQYQNQMQALQQQLATRQQANAEIANTFSQGVQKIGNMIIENRRKKEAEENEQRISNQMEQLKRDNEQAEREQEDADRQKAANEAKIEEAKIAQEKMAEENANIEAWQNKSTSILTANVADYANIKKTSQITDDKLQQVYYVIWNFGADQNQLLIANPVEIKKDGDGDWPMNNDLLQKIQTQTSLIISQTPDRINTSENSLGYLLGYFTDINQALNAIKDIKANAIKNGYTITTINNASHEEKKTNDQKQKTVDDFWKE